MANRTYNHDLLRQAAAREQAGKEFRRIADVLIDTELLAAFGPFEDKARWQKKAVKVVGTISVLMTVTAFSSAIFGVYGIGKGEAVLPIWAGRLAEILALTGLFLACLVAPWGPLRRRWLENRFCAEVLRLRHFRSLLDGAYIERMLGRGRSGDASAVSEVLVRFRQSGAIMQSQLCEHGTDPLGHGFIPTAPSDPGVADELLCAYERLRVVHQDEFFFERAQNMFKDFLWLPNETWARLTKGLTSLALFVGLLASCGTLLFHGAGAWTPIVVAGSTVFGIAFRSWGDGMRFEEEQDHYVRMHSHFRALRSRWECARNIADRLAIAQDLERTAVEELRSFLRLHGTAQFVV